MRVFVHSLLSVMHFVALDVDGREWSRRTHIFARSTTYASRLVNVGHHGREFVVLVEWHHLDGAGGAVAGAVAARHMPGDGQAVLLEPHGEAHMYVGLFLHGDGANGIGGAHLRAACALWAAESALKTHRGHHERGKVV